MPALPRCHLLLLPAGDAGTYFQSFQAPVGSQLGTESRLTFKIGQIHTPFIDWEEALWDYRVQGQMALERGGYMSSSDFGAGIEASPRRDRESIGGEGPHLRIDQDSRFGRRTRMNVGELLRLSPPSPAPSRSSRRCSSSS